MQFNSKQVWRHEIRTEAADAILRGDRTFTVIYGDEVQKGDYIVFDKTVDGGWRQSFHEINTKVFVATYVALDKRFDGMEIVSIKEDETLRYEDHGVDMSKEDRIVVVLDKSANEER